MSDPQVDEDTRNELIECPKCRGRMARHTTEDLSVDRCGACGGLWLDALELSRILERPVEVKALDKGRQPNSGRMDEMRQINCPREGSPMVAMRDVRQPHVRYEQCSVCGGLFLDAGELRDLADYDLAERLREMLS
jgi:Zn-finger nucleic acid-binding protein